ncbi:WRKY transcription factor [Orobanche gracilis]
MGGFDDHVAIMGDWMPPSPSPGSLFSQMTNNDTLVRPFADSVSENKSGPHLQVQAAFRNADQEAINSISMMQPKMNSRGGLMERRAARAGFNAPMLNTEGIRNGELSKDQEIRSPYLTIPPGLSPTSLLDSPVFLTNSLVQPSPTTGKFLFGPSGNNRNSTLMKDDRDKCKENTFEDTTSFAFRPILESESVHNFNARDECITNLKAHLLSIIQVHASGFTTHPFPNFGISVHSETLHTHQSIEPPKTQTSNSLTENNQNSNSPSFDEAQEDDGDQKSSGQAEDGFNWRKYGQKQVKGSEYPRSYYKCTHPNCPVKKKVERSHDGHITEIIYKGAHNHPKPQAVRRLSLLGPSNGAGEILALKSEQVGTGASGDLIWSTVQEPGQNGSQYELGDGVNGSCTFSNDGNDDDDDRVTHGSVSLGCDGEGDESESKRRRIETYASEISGATRAIREPRVVVQTTSEVDILDDGYRWRKYGQKVVKGNPNPRSYYKCTSPGCNVRKHVERASNDLKSVITTYEGKHNHDVPAARNSSHINSGGPNTLQTQQAPTVSHMQRPEPSQIHSSASRFERPSLGSFGLPGRPQQFWPGPGFGFGLNQQRLPDLGLAGLGHNQVKLPVMPAHPYLGHRPRSMNDMSLVLPKLEPKMEPGTDSDGFNSSDGPTVYQQLMCRMPFGPQM